MSLTQIQFCWCCSAFGSHVLQSCREQRALPFPSGHRIKTDHIFIGADSTCAGALQQGALPGWWSSVIPCWEEGAILIPQLARAHDLALATGWWLATSSPPCSFPSPWHRITGTQQMAQSCMEKIAGKPSFILHRQRVLQLWLSPAMWNLPGCLHTLTAQSEQECEAETSAWAWSVSWIFHFCEKKTLPALWKPSVMRIECPPWEISINYSTVEKKATVMIHIFQLQHKQLLLRHREPGLRNLVKWSHLQAGDSSQIYWSAKK